MMLRFLANNIEQLDLARDHVSMGDANNARFGLMLIDNVVEITLHQIAKDTDRERQSYLYRDKPYEHVTALADALGQHFESKLKFAKKLGRIGEAERQSIGIFHGFRNEVYHIGVQHEAVLPALADFYFRIACAFLGSYAPSWIGYSPGTKLPDRAVKYFGNDRWHTDAVGKYRVACLQLSASLPQRQPALPDTLADHMDDIIDQQDTAVDMIATGGPKTLTRDKAVVETFAWRIAFAEEGKAFARQRGWSGSYFGLVEYIAENYPLPLRKDPIPAWKKRSDRVRHERDPHMAMKRYREFMTQTANVRAALEEAHAAVDQYIEEQIERMRGN